MKNKIVLIALFAFTSLSVQATLMQITNCSGAISCEITTNPPSIVNGSLDDGKLLAWDEVQNYTLMSDLHVDNVFDPNASFVSGTSGNYILEAGTIVSSHYIQWDPAQAGSVLANITLDSQVFALITSDNNLNVSDLFLGLSSVTYDNFYLRGLESGDQTTFNGNSIDINWYANVPGDWARLITAYSPGANIPQSVPEPSTVSIFLLMLMGLYLINKQNDNKQSD